MKTNLALVATALTLLAGTAAPRLEARELDLAKVPLFLATSVQPNLVMTMDDSGSMRAAWMPEGAESNKDTGLCGFQEPMFFSKTRNTLYFDPAWTYVPPLKGDGSRFPDANFNAAWIDGFAANISNYAADQVTVDLATAYFPTYELGRTNAPAAPDFIQTVAFVPVNEPILHTDTPKVAIDCNNPTATELATKLPFASNGGANSRAFYYNYIGPNPDNPKFSDKTNPLNYVVVDVTTASPEVQQSFANWYSYYRSRTLLARAAVSETFAPMEPTFRVAWQSLTNDPINASTMVSEFSGSHRDVFFRWLYGFKERNSTPLRNATRAVGEFYRRSGLTPLSPYYDRESNIELSCRGNNHMLITDGYWNEVNPPAVVNDDQASLLLPDSQKTPYQPGSGTPSKIYWNEVPLLAADTKCNSSTQFCLPTLADIAFHYWSTDLRPDLPNEVPRRWKDLSTGITSTDPAPASAALAVNTPEVYFNPVNNPATWQHMVNHIVGMGLAGPIAFPDAYLDLRKGNIAWPTQVNSSSRGAADAWHAAINSRGQNHLATNIAELTEQLQQILYAINEEQGTASAASVTSGIATGDSFAIRTEYDTGDWSGTVRAFPVGLDGFGPNPIWDARAKLDNRSPDGRNILTANGPTGGGVPFRWSALSDDWKMALSDDPVSIEFEGDDVVQGEARLDYLRGVRTKEASKGGPFRTRLSILGSIIYSGAAIVGAPANGYDISQFPEDSPEAEAWDDVGGSYLDFVETHKNRRRVVYVGANDGMLHALDAGVGTDAGTGEELWAYIPFEVSRKIGRLTHPAFGFEPSVDSTPVARDVFIGGRWRTLLIGALRQGGQGIFALDITEPYRDEATADDTVLWEFNDDRPGVEGDRMGYSYGKANIVRLHNGKWAVLLPGGYNNEETVEEGVTDPSVGDGTSSLFVLDAETGAVIKEFNMPGSYGLAFATAGSKDNDIVDDFAVAGDLLGNVWRFDLSDESPASWTAELMYEAAVPEEHPITSAPRIFADTQTGGAVILFGTGKLLETVDGMPVPDNAAAQRIVAIRDRGAASASYPWTNGDLVGHTISEVLNGDISYYKVAAGELKDEDGGWFVNLPESGERVINAPGALFSQGLVVVNSLIPSRGDPCKAVLGGNLFVLDAATGSPVDMGPMFDTNGDGVVGEGDDAGASGVALERSVAEGTPAVIVGVGGGVAAVPEFPNVQIPDPIWKRRHWREVR